MIQLTCTNCRTVLSIDDGFAGGVCRCQHCGTIQTVPSRLRGSAPAGSAAPPPAQSPKALYQNKARQESGSGLDTLAQVVTSSGLGSGLLHQHPPRASRMRRVMLIIGGLLVVAIAVVGVLLLKKAGGPTGGPGGGEAPGPNFFGQRIAGPTVVYVLDRGAGTGDVFEPMKQAALKSIASLAPEIGYQVIFWQNGPTDDSPLAIYPPTGPAAGPATIDQARAAIQDVTYFAQSRAAPAIAAAIRSKPDQILLATGKYDMVSKDVDAVLELIRKHNLRIHTFALGAADAASLRRIADASGGMFHQVAPEELTRYGR